MHHASCPDPSFSKDPDRGFVMLASAGSEARGPCTQTASESRSVRSKRVPACEGWKLGVSRKDAGCSLPQLQAPVPAGLPLVSDSWLCVCGELTHPPWATASSSHAFLAPFHKTCLQGEQRMELMSKLKYDLLLNMGSLGHSRVGLRAQQRAGCGFFNSLLFMSPPNRCLENT